MVGLRRIVTVAGVVAAVVLAIGINRIVVTDGHIAAPAVPAQPHDGVVVAFKSDYFPLEKYEGPLSIDWEDPGMDREWGARDALAFVRKSDLAPSAIAFDAAFGKGIEG